MAEQHQREGQQKYKWLVEVEPAVAAQGDQVPALSPVYRHLWSRDGFPFAPHGSTTCYEIWRNSVQHHGSSPCLGWRRPTPEGKPGPYKFMSYDEADRQVCLLASGLAAAGLRAGDRVAVYAANCPEWMIVLQACNRMNYTCVPVYDTLGHDAVQYVINHAAARALFVASEKLQSVLEVMDQLTAPLLLLVHWGPRPMGHLEPASRAGSASPSLAGEESDGRSIGANAPVSNTGDGVEYVRRMTYAELVEAGQCAGHCDPQPPQPADLTTIMYTSGTTGVQLPHSAVVAAVASLSGALAHYSDEVVGPGDSMLSYLPLAHIFDRVSEETCLAAGACIGYWFGDVALVAEDAAALRPTVFIGVPRVYEKILTTVQHRLSKVNWLRRSVYGAMYGRKLEALKHGARPEAATLRLGLWPSSILGWRAASEPSSEAEQQGAAAGLGLGFIDSIVFGRIRRALGGRLRLVVSGGAPLAGRVEEFLRVTLGCPVAQGYGLTETCAASFMQEPFCWEQVGSVGPPLLCTEFRLRSVPDMGYLAGGGGEHCDLPAGELLIRGPQLFTGYYRRPDLTQEALIPDPGNGAPTAAAAGGPSEGAGSGDAASSSDDPRTGRWFCTGDIAALRPDGSVAIVDRIKNMFKLSQGEYISPERLEAVYGETPVVEQIWVHGSSVKNSLVAVVVPHRNKLLPLAGQVEIIAPSPPSSPSHKQRQHLHHHRHHHHQQDSSVAAAPAGPEGDAGAGQEEASGPGEAAQAAGHDAPTVVGTLCRSPKVRATVLQQLQEVGRANKLRGFELIRAVYLQPEPFTPDNGLLTPTLKLRRPALERHFKREVKAMYEELEQA